MVTAAVALLLGCSNGSGNLGGADAGDAGGAGGNGGSAGSGGGASIQRPAIPAATFESCSALSPSYAGNGCTGACSNVRCDCDPFPTSYLAC
ncbi:MAG TPA: hypothetical protein VJU61_17525, partial [Polyangiaceae bacterium]|nr:hypothetical protein [Polyangiaceae bacterium]